MNCETCKYFHTNENYPEHLGWCDIVLPKWLYEACNLNRYDVNQTVRKDDDCSFWKGTS